jgi:CRP-like cAMP-binding protein
LLFPTSGTLPERIKRLFYFRLLTDTQMSELTALCTILHFEEGELIFQEGAEAECFYIVLSGKVQIYKISREGKEMILHMFGPSEMFAEVPIFSGLPRYPANALCMEASDILSIQGEGFRKLITAHPDIALNILGVLAQRLHKFSELIEDLSMRTVDSRLAKYLLSVSENSPDKALIQVHKKTLASILGTIPETLSRSFKKLSNDQLVHVEGNKIHVLNREGLTILAE